MLASIQTYNNKQKLVSCLECEAVEDTLYRISLINTTTGKIDKIFYNCKFCTKTKYPKYFENKTKKKHLQLQGEFF